MSLSSERTSPGPASRPARRVVAATVVGTTLEWYDFYLYAAMATLVFAPLFFPSSSSVASQLAAFATFAVGFVARPVGAAIAGHFGDRIGRKRMLVITLLAMGVATTAVGLLPTFDTIGMAAPIALVILRVVQGLAMAGEWGGAVAMAAEHAPAGQRTLYSSAPMIGSPLGVVLANVVLLALVTLPDSVFMSWGWRIAFLLSIVLVVIGVWVRRSIDESPLFDAEVAPEPVRVPLVEVLRNHAGTLLKTTVVSGVPGVATYIVLAYILSYGTSEIGYSKELLLTIGIVVCIIQAVLIPVLASLGKRTNPLRLIVIGAGLQGIVSLLFFPLFDSGTGLLAFIACVAVVAPTGLVFAVLPVVLIDRYPPKIRYTGISMAYQLGAIVGGGFAPLIATAILAATGSSFFIGVYMAMASLVMMLCGISLRRPEKRVALMQSGGAS